VADRGRRPPHSLQSAAPHTLLLSFLLEVGRLDLADTISLTSMPITNYYVSSDGMGNVTAIVDEDGNVLERRNYDAFGEMSCMLPDGTPVATSPTGVDVGFHGQVREEATGLYQMGYRWYSPTLGRWLSRDPIGLKGGVNLAASFENSPVCLYDYLGTATVRIWLQVGRCCGDGEPQITMNNPTGKELRDKFATLDNGSVCRVSISGHGGRSGIVINDKNDDGIANEGAAGQPIYSDDGSSFADSIRTKLTPAGSCVQFKGCNTASNLVNNDHPYISLTWHWFSAPDDNIAQRLSAQLKGVQVTGSLFFAAGWPPTRLGKLPSWSISVKQFTESEAKVWVPLTRTYVDGVKQ